MKGNFVQQGKAEMHDFVRKAIDDLLDVLDSAVEFPTDKEGKILYNKLFTIVQSREQVWLSCTELMDMAEIDRTSNKTYLNRIVRGFETTWHEMTKIVCMDIGEYQPNSESVLSLEDMKQLARESVTDDKLSSISKAKVLAAKLSYQILDRIEKLTNPDAQAQLEPENIQSSSLIEKYAEN